MNKLMWQTLPALCVAGLLISARAQDNNPPPPPDTNNVPETPGQPGPGPGEMPLPPDAAGQPAEGNGTSTNGVTGTNDTPAAVAAPTVAEDRPAARSASLTNTSPDAFMPPAAAGTNVDALRLNFRNAPLEMVLNYLSDAAGFIIVLDTQVHGSVSVISSHPMTRDEAVDLLNAVLNKNGYAAIRDGRTLTIVDKNDAKTRNIPVKVSNDPDKIPNNAEIVTQIIPIRFVEAEQLAKDLSLFVSPQATIVANEAGNSIVVTDTQSNIRHLVEIIKAIDSSAEGETQIRVFHLAHASPADVASELGQIFPSTSGSSGATQSPIRFGGGGAGGPGGFFARMMGGGGGFGGGGGGGAAAGGGSNSRMQKQTQVTAVADPRTSSVIVTASADLMQEITGMMTQLDVPSQRDQKVFVYHLDHGDPQQTLQVLQNMFGGSSSTSSRGGSSSSTSSALGNRQTQNATSTGTSTSTGIGGSGLGGGGGGGRGGL